MGTPLISVIIPTRNRQKYALKTIHQILGLNLGIEVIIHDNSDTDILYSEIEDLVKAKKVLYGYEKELLPFSENYNRAAEMATGRFLCAIGDDDGILPNIISCAKWMESKGIDVLKPAKDQVYFYPGNINKKRNACVGFGRYSASYYFSIPESSLISLLNDGGCNYLEKDMPGSYHGLVSMNSMNEIKKITGKYYSGLTPDMYSVVCLSLLPRIRFAVLDLPITLPGVCPSSGSAASDSGKHIGKLEDAPHLKAFPNYVWSDYVPRYYSVETIWAETMICAIKKMGREELIEKYFNQERLAMHLYMNNQVQRKEILNALSEKTANNILECCGDEGIRRSNLLSTMLGNAAMKISRKRKVIRKVNDISAAVKILSQELENEVKRVPWSK